jgi:hypothetical protein
MNKIKLLGLSILTLLLVTFNSCSEDDEIESSGATVEITVKHNEQIQTGYPVNMFDAQTGPSTTFFTAFHSKKTVVTNDNGVAIFKLQDVYDLNVIDNQTTLYFAVFSTQGNAYKAITIEKGETKSATIVVE